MVDGVRGVGPMVDGVRGVGPMVDGVRSTAVAARRRR